MPSSASLVGILAPQSRNARQCECEQTYFRTSAATARTGTPTAQYQVEPATSPYTTNATTTHTPRTRTALSLPCPDGVTDSTRM